MLRGSKRAERAASPRRFDTSALPRSRRYGLSLVLVFSALPRLEASEPLSYFTKLSSIHPFYIRVSAA